MARALLGRRTSRLLVAGLLSLLIFAIGPLAGFLTVQRAEAGGQDRLRIPIGDFLHTVKRSLSGSAWMISELVSSWGTMRVGSSACWPCSSRR